MSGQCGILKSLNKHHYATIADINWMMLRPAVDYIGQYKYLPGFDGYMGSYLLFVVEQRGGEGVSDEPLLSLHDDVPGRVMLGASVRGPHGGDRTRLQLHGAVELEQCLLVTCLAKDLVAAQAQLLYIGEDMLNDWCFFV